jgi:hypothetical protein
MNAKRTTHDPPPAKPEPKPWAAAAPKPAPVTRAAPAPEPTGAKPPMHVRWRTGRGMMARSSDGRASRE